MALRMKIESERGTESRPTREYTILVYKPNWMKATDYNCQTTMSCALIISIPIGVIWIVFGMFALSVVIILESIIIKRCY